MVRMGNATREQVFAAFAAVLGVAPLAAGAGLSACQREEPTQFPVAAREVPSAAPRAVELPDAAPIDSFDASAATEAAAPSASATPIPSASARPQPPPMVPTPLASFERFAPPPPKGAGPAPPPPPPEHCCGNSAVCGPRSCPGGGVNLGNGPHLVTRSVVGLRPKAGLDDDARGRAQRWINQVGASVAGCASVGGDEKAATVGVDVHADARGAIVVAFTAPTLSESGKSCLAHRASYLANGVTVEGAVTRIAFTVAVTKEWVKGGGGVNLGGQP